jgi:hypothetical protein
LGKPGQNRIKQALTFVVVLVVASVLAGCGDRIPEFPSVWQCQWNGTPRAFYCVNTRTKERLKLDADSSRMKAAQCLSALDYKKTESWAQTVKEIALSRCQ